MKCKSKDKTLKCFDVLYYFKNTWQKKYHKGYYKIMLRRKKSICNKNEGKWVLLSTYKKYFKIQ